MSPIYRGEVMASIFTARDPVLHRQLKSPVSNLYSMTNMRKYEQYADECTGIFMDVMRELEGQKVDLSNWVQYYAFDVIASISFKRRFGFMEQRHDVDEMIEMVDSGLPYVKIIGQFPLIHHWVFGNVKISRILNRLLGIPDVLRRFVEVWFHGL